MKDLLTDRKELLWLNRTIPKARIWILLLTLVRTIQGMTGVGFAACLREIVDDAVAGSRPDVLRSLVLFVGLILLQFLLSAAGRHLSELASANIENTLKLRLLDRLFCRDYSQVTAVHSGEWMNRLTSDTSIVAHSAIQILPGAAGMIAKMVSAAGMLLYLIPQFAIFLLCGGGVLILSTFWIRKFLKQLHKRIQERDGYLRVFLTERLGSLMILKSYQQEAAAEQEAADLMADHKTARMHRNHISNVLNSGFSLLMNSTYVLGAAYCGFGILNGSIGYGTFTAVIQLVGQLQTPIAGITGFVPQYYAMLASTERLMEAEAFAECPRAQKPADFSRFQGFGLDHVTYAYHDSRQSRQDAISDLSFEVRKGQYVAFAGPSGCGKSTVLKLLLQLYHPDSGCVYIHTDTEELPLDSSWSQIFAYVPQGNHLMSGTIRQVVSFSRPELAGNDEEIYEALDIACAKEFVQALPAGLDTLLGERGCGLSEGQMQRLAVARALFSRRPVLLLDEATSALDGPSEVRLLTNIRTLTGKTVVIVTHRPAALEIVDKVIRFSEK